MAGLLGQVWCNTAGSRISPGFSSGPTHLEGDTLLPTLLEQLYNSRKKLMQLHKVDWPPKKEKKNSRLHMDSHSDYKMAVWEQNLNRNVKVIKCHKYRLKFGSKIFWLNISQNWLHTWRGNLLTYSSSFCLDNVSCACKISYSPMCVEAFLSTH